MSSNSLQCTTAVVLNSNPTWLTCSVDHYLSSLISLTLKQLQPAAFYFFSKNQTLVNKHTKMSYIHAILDHFTSVSKLLASCQTDSLWNYIHDLAEVNMNSDDRIPRLCLFCIFLDSVYGNEVASALRILPWSIKENFPEPSELHLSKMPWLSADLTAWMDRLPRKWKL